MIAGIGGHAHPSVYLMAKVTRSLMLEVRRALDRGGGRSAGGSESPWLIEAVPATWWAAMLYALIILPSCWIL